MVLPSDVIAVLEYWQRVSGDDPLSKGRRQIANELLLTAKNPTTKATELPLLSEKGSFLVARLRRRWYVFDVASGLALDSPKTTPPPTNKNEAERRANRYETLLVAGLAVDWKAPETAGRLHADNLLLKAISLARTEADLDGLRADDADKKIASSRRGARFERIGALRDHYLAGGEPVLSEGQQNWMRATGRRKDISLSEDGGFVIIPLNRAELDYYGAFPAGSGLSIPALQNVNHKSKMHELLKAVVSAFSQPGGRAFDWSAPDLQAEVDRWNKGRPMDFETRLMRVRAQFDRNQGYTNSAAIEANNIAEAAGRDAHAADVALTAASTVRMGLQAKTGDLPVEIVSVDEHGTQTLF